MVMDKLWNEVVVDVYGRVFVNCIGFEMMSGEVFLFGVIVVVEFSGDVC